MKIIYTVEAKKDIEYWKQNNLKIVARINKLIGDIKLHPFYGVGKPEKLRFDKSGYWSRRINKEHRLVCFVKDNIVYIAQSRYHYGD